MKLLVRTVLCALLIGVPAFGAEPDAFTPPVEAGRYGTAVVIAPDAPGSLNYRFVTSAGTAHTEFFIPLDAPLLLDVPPSAEGTYNLEFQRRADGEIFGPYTYIVDRALPQSPHPDRAPGVYSQGVDISFSTPDEVVDVRYALRASPRETQSRHARFISLGGNEPITLAGTAGAVVDITIYVYAIDGAGNRSGTSQWTYRIDRRNEVSHDLDLIKSPVSGSYANEQLLYLATAGYRNLRVRLEGPDGVRTFPYTGETIIGGHGGFTATVSARIVDTGEEVVRTVAWVQGREEAEGLPSGRYTETVTVFDGHRDTPPRFSLEDRPVKLSDNRILEPLQLRVANDVLRTVVLRLSGGSDGSTEERRLFYILDGRKMPPPEFAAYDGNVVLYSLAGAEIEYALSDGGQPDWRRYAGPFQLDPGDIDGALVARGRFTGAEWGATARIPASQVAAALDTFRRPAAASAALRQEGDVVVISPTGDFVQYTDAPDRDGAGIFTLYGQERAVWHLPRGYRSTVTNTFTDDEPSVTLLNAPPAPPHIFRVDGGFRIDSSLDAFYRVDGGSFLPYAGGTVELPPGNGLRRDYLVEGYVRSADDVSPVVSHVFSVDRRELILPAFLNPPESEITGDGMYLTNAAEFSITFAPFDDDMRIHYEIAEGRRAPIPNQGSPILSNGGTVTLSTENGSRREYSVRMRGRFTGRTGWTETREIRVVLDRDGPAPPVVKDGGTAGLVVGRERIVEFEAPRDDGELWFRIGPDGPFQPYRRAVAVRRPGSSTETVVLEAYSVDEAGNRSYLQPPLTIPFAATAIPTPDITADGEPLSGARHIVDAGASIGIAVAAPHRAFWRLYPPEDREKPAFQEYRDGDAVTFGGERGLYVVEAYLLDETTGSRSSIRRMEVAGSSLQAEIPDEPFIIRDEEGNSGIATWPGRADRSIYASLSSETTGFQPVDESFPWRIPDGAEHITISYYVRDDAKGRSETRKVTISRTTVPRRPDITGADEGAVYTAPRTITFEGDGDIRYTLSTDGREAPPVHPLSARYEGPFSLDVSPGEDVTFHLRAAAVGDDGALSPDRRVSFRIDKAAPAPPVLVGAEDGDYFPDTTKVRLENGEEDQQTDIYYRLGDDPDREYGRYDGSPITLALVPGQVTTYRIESYARDRAGNRSQHVAAWDVHVDGAIIYVDPSATAGDGTREHPFTHIGEAYDLLRRSDRRTIFLAGGEYRPDASLFSAATEESEAVSIIGGFDGSTWMKGNVSSTLTFPEARPLPITSDILLRDVVLAGTPSVEISAENVIFQRLLAGETMIRHRRGTLTATVLVASELLSSGGTTRAEISQSELGGVVVRDGATVTITESTIRKHDGGASGGGPSGSGGPTAGGIVPLRVSGGNLSIDRSVISASGPSFVHGVSSRGGNVTIRRSVLHLSGGSEGIGVVAIDSTVVVEESGIFLSGGADGLRRAMQVTGTNGQSHILDRVVMVALDGGGNAAIRMGSRSSVDLIEIAVSGWTHAAVQEVPSGWGRATTLSRDSTVELDTDVLSRVNATISAERMPVRDEILAFLQEIVSATFGSNTSGR